MKQTKVEIIKSTQQNRVGVQETFKYLSSNSGGTKKPRRPRKSFDERITEAVTKAIKPVLIRLDKIEDRLDRNQIN